MSIRVEQFEFRCKDCDVSLILLSHDMTCPNCGRIFVGLPKEETVFSEHAIGTMRYYKEDHGFYRPLGFYIASLGDAMLSVTYYFFDLLEQKNPDDLDVFLEHFLKNDLILEKEEEQYLRQHYRDALKSVLEKYQDSDLSKIKRREISIQPTAEKVDQDKKKISWFKRLYRKLIR